MKRRSLTLDMGATTLNVGHSLGLVLRAAYANTPAEIDAAFAARGVRAVS